MKRTFPIEQGICYGGGKLIPWSLLFEVLDEALDEKTRRLVRRKLHDNVSFHDANLTTETTEVAALLGVKEGVNLHTRIMKKIQSLNTKVEEPFFLKERK